MMWYHHRQLCHRLGDRQHQCRRLGGVSIIPVVLSPSSYATGTVTGDTSVGGLVGYNDLASSPSSYATGCDRH